MSLSNDHIATNEIPLLEQLTDLQKRRLHLFAILLKQYIYACKCFEKKPIKQEFQTKLSNITVESRKYALPWASDFFVIIHLVLVC